MTALGRPLSTLLLSLALALSAAVCWPEAAHAGAAAECRRTLPRYPTLEPGDRRPAVRTLQCAINDTGMGPVVVDGYYGPQTQAALTRIVSGREDAISVEDYRLTPYFWCQLYGIQLPERDLARGDHGEAVRDLQRALRAFRIPVVVDGDFGPQTEHAVKRFQRLGEMRVNGRADERTRYFLAGGFYL